MSNSLCDNDIRNLLFDRHADIWTSYAKHFHDIYQAMKLMRHYRETTQVKNWSAHRNNARVIDKLFCAFRDTLIHYVPYLKQLHIIETKGSSNTNHRLLLNTFEAAVLMLETAVTELAKVADLLSRRNLRANLSMKGSIRGLLAREKRRLGQLHVVKKTLDADLRPLQNTTFAGPVQLYLSPLINSLVSSILMNDGLTDAGFKRGVKHVRDKVAPVLEAKTALENLPYKSLKEKHIKMQQLLRERSERGAELAAALSVNTPFARTGVVKLHNETKGQRAIDPRALAFVRTNMYRGGNIYKAEGQARNQLSNYTSYDMLLREVKLLQRDVKDVLKERVEADTFRWPPMKALMAKLSNKPDLAMKNMPTLAELPLPIFESDLEAVYNTLASKPLLHNKVLTSLGAQANFIRKKQKSRFGQRTPRVGPLQAKNVQTLAV